MKFRDESVSDIPGNFGVRLEDIMIIMQFSAELLTPPSTPIQKPFSPV